MSYLCPAIGSVISVVTRYRDPASLTGEYRYNHYDNVPVVEKDPWTQPGEFCIPADNEPYITKRTIHVDNVFEMVVHGNVADTATETGTTFVKVAGGKGQTYTVTLVNGIAKSCECLGFQYRKACRHLKEAMGETATPKPAKAKKAAKTVPTAPVKVQGKTKADAVRFIIGNFKKQGVTDCMDATVIHYVMSACGFKRALAVAYLKNNWSKV
jgi:hypothetical protein